MLAAGMCGLWAIRAAWGLLNWEPLQNDSGVSAHLRATPGAARSPTNDEARLGEPGPSRVPSGDRTPVRTGRPTTRLPRFGRSLGAIAPPPGPEAGARGGESQTVASSRAFSGACAAAENGFPPCPGLDEDKGGAELSRDLPLGR